jgi:hypothetical protein
METIFEQQSKASETILLLQNAVATNLLGVAYNCGVSSMMCDYLSSCCIGK